MKRNQIDREGRDEKMHVERETDRERTRAKEREREKKGEQEAIARRESRVHLANRSLEMGSSRSQVRSSP